MLKAAVIGVGSMGKNHARVYQEMDETQLIGIADIEETTLRSVQKKYQVEGYSNYQELLKNAKPDIVTIAVPTALHEEVASEVMKSGADILIEKPIAATINEGQRLIELAEKLDRKMMIGHIVRFNPAMQLLKQKLQAGELGKIFQVVCRRVGPFPVRIRDVGVVVDLAPHDLDIIRFLTGLDPVRVYAETEQCIHTDHEDLVYGLLRFPGGITGALEINWLTPTKLREVVVLGERGAFRLDDLMQDLYFYENAQANGELWSQFKTLKGVSEGTMTRFYLTRYEPLKAELQAFVHAIKENKSVPVSGKDGLAALKLALALVESGQTHQIIQVENGFA
jgi:UDP-N-acetylglucosamine 3-dehydrogenase